MNPAEQLELPDLTPLLHAAFKLAVVLVLGCVVVGLLRVWWHNRRVAAPPQARGGAIEPIARVLRGASSEWDEQLIAAGLMVKRAGRLYRPRILAASRTELRIEPVPGSMPRWLHPATVAHLSQIADHTVTVSQLGKCVVIQG